VDGDGDLEALSASANDHKIAWYENDGSGAAWTLHTISTTADGARSVFAADVDGDGDLDALSLFTPYFIVDVIGWYENDGTGTTWTFHTISASVPGGGFSSVFAADIDGDGDLDVLSEYDDFPTGQVWIAWYENAGAGTGWGLHTVAMVETRAISVAADVDGDGDLDALSGLTGGNKIAWYENDGAGTAWTLHTISTAANGARSVFAADVDGDGDLDAVSASFNDSKIAWYENDGTGAAWRLHTLSTTARGASSVFAADVDGDGDVDGLSASTDDTIAWYENRGTFVFADGFDSDGDASCWAGTVP
jgi:hypothetical protein